MKPFFGALILLLHGAALAADPVEFLNSAKVLSGDLPFSEAVRVHDTLYLSGQIGTRPGTAQLIGGGVLAETQQAMKNIEMVLHAHGYTMNDIVKCTVMLTDMSDWPRFNQVYRGFFKGHYPARSAFGVQGLALGASVEVECVAVKSAAASSKVPSN